jgi:two-component system response regulator HydG
MDTRTQDPSAPPAPTRPEPDLLVCLAAIGRALEGEFHPRAFLDDLSTETAAGRFRSDLFYRLSVFDVHLSPLRERGDDVLLLADHFIRTPGPQMGKADLMLSRNACELRRRHSWPGNIRELQNAIERALITSQGTLITAAHPAIPPGSQPAAPPPQAAPPPPAGAAGSLHDLERAAIIEALQQTHGHKSRAAALLGLTRFQLHTRLKRFGIH